MEGKRSRWGGWPSKPERAVSRFLVGSTPTLFRHPPCLLSLRLGRIENGVEIPDDVDAGIHRKMIVVAVERYTLVRQGVADIDVAHGEEPIDDGDADFVGDGCHPGPDRLPPVV